MEVAPVYRITPHLASSLPRHIAIVMDGNGRWASRRRLPRPTGHVEGLKAVRRIVEACAQRNVKVLSLFAFSSENWQRPSQEVRMLLHLFLVTLRSESRRLQQYGIRLRVIGDLRAFSTKLQQRVRMVEESTCNNTGLQLVVAANYGGRWDIAQAARRLVQSAVEEGAGDSGIDLQAFQRHTMLADLPDPELLIRTGGEQRLSNFFLWQMADTVCFFSERLWPDFFPEDLDQALDFFTRQHSVAPSLGGGSSCLSSG